MNINPGMVAPLASKNIVHLSKNTPVVKELLSAILKAMEHVGAHKIFSQKCTFLFLSISPPVYYRSFFFLYIFYLFSHHGLRLRYAVQVGDNSNGHRKSMI
jgi:hypothetical protein